MIRILFLGEIVGRPGVTAIKKGLATLKGRYEIDYTIANAEGITNGFGMGKIHSISLGKMGIDLLTGGEKLFYKVDMVEFIAKASFILRPANYPQGAPGRYMKYITVKDRKLAIISLQGNSDFPRQNLQNAFLSADGILKKLEEDPKIVPLIFFHAATTAEKATMLFFADGRAAAVIGTHTKVQSADERVTEKGTAFISDNGRVGSLNSVGGFDPDTEIRKLRSQLPLRSQECWNEGIIQGVIVEIDEITGLAVGIKRISEPVTIEKPEDKES